MSDSISRQAAIDALRRAEAITRAFGYHHVIDTIRELPSAQPDVTDINVGDIISRAAAIDALAKAMPSLTTPDGCGEFDHDIYVTDEAYVDCMQIIHELPSAQPEIIRCTDCIKFATEACPMYICDGWMKNELDDYCSYADKVTERSEHE